MGLIAIGRGDLDSSIGYLREAIALGRQTGLARGHFGFIRSLYNMAVVHIQRGEHADARRFLQEALDVARRARNIEQISFSNIGLALNDLWQGNWADAKRRISDNLELQLSPVRRLECKHLLSYLNGEREAAASLARDIARYHLERGNLNWYFGFGGFHTWHNLELGHIQDAFISASEFAEISERTGSRLAPPTTVFVVEGLARGGAYDRCEALCARMEASGRAVGSPHQLAGAFLGRAVAAFEHGNREAAAALLEESLPFAERSGPVLHAHVLHKLGRVLIERAGEGDLERAGHTLRECLTLLERMGDARKAAQVRADLGALG